MTERDRGAATVMVVGVIGVLLATTASALVLSGVVLASQRARLAADLGALAGAARLQQASSTDAACAEAARVVRANNALLQGCTVAGMELEVVVAVTPQTWSSAAVARSRAGPGEPPWREGNS